MGLLTEAKDYLVEVNPAKGETGATVRTLRAKLQELVSVQDFGAVGDGVTDDTVAFQNADASGSYINVPAGTYVVTAPVAGTFYTTSGGVSIIGGGSVTILSSLLPNSVTLDRLEQISATTILGNPSGSAGDVVEMTLAQLQDLLDTITDVKAQLLGVRQTALGPVTSATNRVPALGGTTGTATLTTTAITPSDPLYLTAANGFDAYGRPIDRYAKVIGNVEWTAPGGGATVGYLGFDISAAGVATPVVSNSGAAPSFSPNSSATSSPLAVTNGQFKFDTQKYTQTVGDGTTAVASYRVYVGECNCSAGVWSGVPRYYQYLGVAYPVQYGQVSGVSAVQLIGSAKFYPATHWDGSFSTTGSNAVTQIEFETWLVYKGVGALGFVAGDMVKLTTTFDLTGGASQTYRPSDGSFTVWFGATALSLPGRNIAGGALVAADWVVCCTVRRGW